MKKPFDRILIVMFENQYRSYVIQHPFMQKLATAGAELTNYFGAFHPSQTNYIASLAGEVCGVTNDSPPASPLPQQTLVDLLEAKNVSWKARTSCNRQVPQSIASPAHLGISAFESILFIFGVWTAPPPRLTLDDWG